MIGTMSPSPSTSNHKIARDMKLHHTATALVLFLPLLHSCNEVDEISGDNVAGNSPIVVSAETASPFTRSYIPLGMYDNFKVFAASEQGGTRTVVMDGYKVEFLTDDWTYVSETQSLMYWNSNADRYLFTAGAPVDAVAAISATSMTLSLENNTTGSAMACQPLRIERTSADFGHTVNLRFGYAHCRVCVAFMKNAAESVTVEDVRLTPDIAIASKAELTYSYDWSTTTPAATPQLSVKASSGASLGFDRVTIPSSTSDAVLSETRHYCVPDAANTTGWTISLTVNGQQKSASFVNSEKWESGKNYIYVFSLEENGPKLVHVISQDNFFYCEDILPGDKFSNADMTE